MKIILAFISTLSLSGCLLLEAGMNAWRVDLRNACNIPIHVDVPKYVNDFTADSNEVTESISKYIEPNEETIVLSLMCEHCETGIIPRLTFASFKKIFPKDYIMTISTGKFINTINSEQFLKIVENSRRRNEGNWWTINDTSLCP